MINDFGRKLENIKTRAAVFIAGRRAIYKSMTAGVTWKYIVQQTLMPQDERDLFQRMVDGIELDQKTSGSLTRRPSSQHNHQGTAH